MTLERATDLLRSLGAAGYRAELTFEPARIPLGAKTPATPAEAHVRVPFAQPQPFTIQRLAALDDALQALGARGQLVSGHQHVQVLEGAS